MLQLDIFLDFEDGLKHLDGEVQVLPFYQLKEVDGETVFDQFLGSYELIPEDSTVILDSADWLEASIDEDVCKKYHAKTVLEIPYGKGNSYRLERWGKTIKYLEYLIKEKNCNIIILCHSQIKKFEGPMGPSFDFWTLKMHDKSAAKLTEWVDAIFFLTLKKTIISTDAGFGRTKAKAVGRDERVLYCTQNPAYLAGNRFGIPSELDASYEAITNARNQKVAK